MRYGLLTLQSGKYLPALRCLLAARQLNPNHPKCHEQGCRLKLGLEKLEQPLSPQIKEVVDSLYLSKLSNESLEDGNEKYLESHQNSAPHVESAVRFRRILKPEVAETKTKGVNNLQDTLSLDSTTLQQAVDGLQLLEDIEANASEREAYVSAARERWPEATVFHMTQ